MDFTNEISEVAKSVNELGKKIDEGYATKHELKKYAEAVDGLSKNMDRQRMERKINRVFGDEATALQFVDCLKSTAAQNPALHNVVKGSSLDVTKDLNTYGTGTGIELVPTAVSNIFSMLLSQGFIGRKYATVLNGIQGNIALTKRNGTSTAAFTSASSTDEDDAAVTPSVLGTAKVTLSPQQISSLSLISEKLLFCSAVNIAEMVAIDLVEQAGVLEDNTILKGDGTYSYGGCTGLTQDSSVPKVSLTYSSFTSLDKVFALIGQVHESVQNSPNSRFFMSGAMWALIRAFKPTNYTYYLEPTTGLPTIAGYPVQLWHRMDTTIATGKNVVLFGDMSKAVTVGIGRDISLVADRSYKFNTNQVAYRLTYDFASVDLQPTAMSYLALTS